MSELAQRRDPERAHAGHHLSASISLVGPERASPRPPEVGTIALDVALDEVGRDSDSGTWMSGVYSGVLMDDGFAVGENDGLTLRYYSWSGQLLHTAGGLGSGPGEFRRIRHLARRPEGVLVLDPVLGRMSLFGKGGQFLRSTPLPDGILGEAEWVVESGAGMIVGVANSVDPRVAGSYMRDPLTVRAVDGSWPKDKADGHAPAVVRVPHRWWQHVPSTNSYRVQALFDGLGALDAGNGADCWVAANEDSVLVRVVDGELQRIVIHGVTAPLKRSERGIPGRGPWFSQLIVASTG